MNWIISSSSDYLGSNDVMISALERMRMEEVVDWSEALSRLLSMEIKQDGLSQGPDKYEAGRCPVIDVSLLAILETQNIVLWCKWWLISKGDLRCRLQFNERRRKHKKYKTLQSSTANRAAKERTESESWSGVCSWWKIKTRMIRRDWGVQPIAH
jgi:hypothetical protein